MIFFFFKFIPNSDTFESTILRFQEDNDSFNI